MGNTDNFGNLLEVYENFLSQGLKDLANMSIAKLKQLIIRLRKNGSQASLESIKLIKAIIERKKQESLQMTEGTHGKNTYGMGRQNFQLYD